MLCESLCPILCVKSALEYYVDEIFLHPLALLMCEVNKVCCIMKIKTNSFSYLPTIIIYLVCYCKQWCIQHFS